MNDKIKEMILAGSKKAGNILDKFLEFSDAQAMLTCALGDNLDSTNKIDVGDATQMPARGTPLFLNITVNVAFGAGATTFQVAILHSTDNSTWTTAFLSQTIAMTALATVGETILKMALPVHNLNRYIKLSYIVSAGDGGTAKVDAWIGLDAPTGITETTQYGWEA